MKAKRTEMSIWQTIKELGKHLKEEVTMDNKYYWYQLLSCVIVTCTIIGSFFVTKLAYVATGLLFLGIITNSFINNKTLFSLSFLIFFLPFSNVITVPNLSISMYSLAVTLFVACSGIKWIIQIFRKEKKLEWKIFIPFGLLITYLGLLFIFKFYSLTFLFSAVIGVMLLFIIAINRKEISFKEVGFSLVLGLLISCLIGLFYEHFPNLTNFYNITYALGNFRYSALFPNTNAFSFCVLFTLGCVGTLYISRKINILYFPIALLLLVISFATISKMVILMVVVIVPLTWLLKILYCKTLKERVIVSVAIILMFSLSVVIRYNDFKTMIDRLEVSSPAVEQPVVDQPVGDQPVLDQPALESPGDEAIKDDTTPTLPENSDQENASDVSKNENQEQIESNGQGQEEKIDQFLTGRLGLWKNSLKSIFENPTSMLFGHRLGSDYNIGDGNYQLGSPHNTYLQCVYHVGIIGFGLICMSLLSLVDIKSLKNFAKSGILLVVVIVLMFGTLDNFSYMGFMYLSMVVLSLTGQQIKDHGEEKNDT